jgi:hypothetical protein
MTGFISLIRNLVLAGILAWLGVEFAPADQDEADQGQPDSVILAILR